MQLIICDNKDIVIEHNKDDKIIYTEDIQPCIGCFNC